jgi:hypothetical protein
VNLPAEAEVGSRSISIATSSAMQTSMSEKSREFREKSGEVSLPVMTP